MTDNRKYLPSIILSMVALLFSGVTIYLEFFRSISFDFVVSRRIFIANTVGGMPDMNVGFVVRADGPSTKTMSLDAEIILKKYENW